MNDQDLKYLLLSYQQKSFDLFTQLVASEAKNKNLNDIVENLKKQISNLEELINSKTEFK